jgi:hypothetical protein
MDGEELMDGEVVASRLFIYGDALGNDGQRGEAPRHSGTKAFRHQGIQAPRHRQLSFEKQHSTTESTDHENDCGHR